MSDGLSFQELLQLVRAGDQDAARTLVQRYEPTIRRVVQLRLTDTRLATHLESLDICQSVLASFFVRLRAGQYVIEHPEQLLKLLVTIARNKLASQARAQQRQRRDYRRIQAGGLNEELLAAAGPSPSQQVECEELVREAERLLSPKERQLVEMRKDGLEWGEIAEKLGGSPEALRKQLARAVDRVAHQLQLDDILP
jgi:RNA polymerase sigma factor (sigma-70 family)